MHNFALNNIASKAKVSNRACVKGPPEETEVFSTNILWTFEARPYWFPSQFGFLAILNTSPYNTLSEAVLLGKSLKSP